MVALDGDQKDRALGALVEAGPTLAAEDPVDRLLGRVSTSSSPVGSVPAGDGGLRTARVLSLLDGQHATIRSRTEPESREALIAPELERQLLIDAVRDGQLVLVERDRGGVEVIVGILQIKRPTVLRLLADEVEITAKRSLLFSAGRAAMRLRQDGDVELVGSRLSLASRGLFRLVGRMLRLN
jgi:hypothetical protein